MSTYTLNLTLTNIRMIAVALIDIFVMWLIFYYALRIVRSNTRTIQIFKGIILVIVVDGLAKLLGLRTLEFFTDMFINWGFLAIIIIFQPEIRSILERIGKSNMFSRISTLTGNEKENLVDQIVTAVMLLSKDQTGALISIEQDHSLDDFIATGTRLNSDVTAELLTSIFVTSTPLHDGAVIIQGDKIACASAYFPPTNMELPSRFGARHRAAIGISEITDAVTIVVSEETGNVSITEGGKIFSVDRQQLRDYLLRVICGEATEVRSSHHNNNKPEKKNPTVLSKLALRKQEEPVDDKVKVESVKPAETEPVNTEVAQRTKAEEVHKAADAEAIAAEIKLPHKKKRPKPSYPHQEKKNLPDIDADEIARERKQPERMTPEEVQAARDAALKSMKHDQPEEKQKPVINSGDKRFDTTRLDISKIVGFNNELDHQFDLVDDMKNKDTSDKKKGGSRK